jgi:molecular chaperone GrpE
MDGEMVDPVDPPDEPVPADTPSRPLDASAGGDEFADGPERSSEVDDVTGSVPRPDDFDDIVAGLDDPALDGSADEATVDWSDVDVPKLLAEREEYRDLAQRIQADFDNYRKRAAAQSLAEADRASGRLAEALLPVLDAAEAAYLRHPDEIGPLLNQMLVELKRHGLETLDLENKPFDPEVAEAVAHEPGDGGEPIVSEVLRSGYTWKGRVLRAAMVKTKD